MRAIFAATAALLWAAETLAQPLPPPAGGPAGGETVYVATTAGPVSLTGNVVETNMANLRIPANSMGKNGVVEVHMLWTMSTTANNKTMVQRFTSGSGQTAGGSTGNPVVSNAKGSAQTLFIITNTNSTATQSFWSYGADAPYASVNPNPVGTLSQDTTQDTWININGQLAVGTDTLTLQHAFAVVYYHQ